MHPHYKTVSIMKPSVPPPKPTANSIPAPTKATYMHHKVTTYKMERYGLSAKTLDSSYNPLRGWTPDTKVDKGKSKCSRDLTPTHLLTTEGRCCKIKTFLKA